MASLNAAQAKPAPAQAAPKPSQNSSLDFLGTYSAPNAVLATETGHTSAHPPAPTTGRRLRQIESAVAILTPWPQDLIWPARALAAQCSEEAGANPASVGPPARGLRQDLARTSVKPRETTLAPLLAAADRSMRLKRFAEARSNYQEFLRLRPGCTPAQWNLAVAQAYLNTPQSTAGIHKWLQASPSPQGGELLAGLLEMRRSSAALGAQEIERALKSGTVSGASVAPRTRIWSLVIARQSSGDLAGARAGLLQLLPANPDSPEVWYALGSVALREARTASRRLAEIAPGGEWNRKLESEALVSRYPELARAIWPESASTVAPAETTTGRTSRSATSSSPLPLSPAQALTSAQSIATSLGLPGINSANPQALYAKARKFLDLAGLAFGQSARAPGFEAQMDALRALAAEQEDDEKQALAIYRQGILEHPNSAVLHAGLGELYRHDLELDKARQELEKAWQLDSSDPLVAYELGDACQRLSEPQRAVALLNQALKLDPSLLLARWSRAKAYLAMGDFERAADDFKAAAPIDRTGEVEWQLARVYRRLGQPDLARASEERAEALRKKQAADNPQP